MQEAKIKKINQIKTELENAKLDLEPGINQLIYLMGNDICTTIDGDDAEEILSIIVKLQNKINKLKGVKKTKHKRKSRRKKIKQFSKDGKLIKTYESISQASEETGIPESNISYAASGKRKTAGKYIWKY